MDPFLAVFSVIRFALSQSIISYISGTILETISFTDLIRLEGLCRSMTMFIAERKIVDAVMNLSPMEGECLFKTP